VYVIVWKEPAVCDVLGVISACPRSKGVIGILRGVKGYKNIQKLNNGKLYPNREMNICQARLEECKHAWPTNIAFLKGESA
jgi:hypothetical protein